MATTHSDKALKTLTLLGTAPADWRQVDILWKEEWHDNVPCRLPCPVCRGNRYVPAMTKEGQGQVGRLEGEDYYAWQTRAGAAGANFSTLCDHCWNPRKRYSEGTIAGTERALVWVGYAQWPAGTKFDSRFANYDRHCCELCSKTLKDAWSARVPVVGQAAGGEVHGMWVGEDCARKFLPGAYTHIYANGDKKTSGQPFLLR